MSCLGLFVVKLVIRQVQYCRSEDLKTSMLYNSSYVFTQLHIWLKVLIELIENNWMGRVS